MTYALVLHGGAGAQPGKDYSRQTADLQNLISEGQDRLMQGQSALDVVVWAVERMEASGLYVAGKGTAPASNGHFELDASLMDGSGRRAGAVAAVEGVLSPIHAAKAVLEDGRHVMLSGAGAASFAASVGLDMVDDPASYYTDHVAHGSAEAARHGTVGAVALDIHGGLAAGTSTGGTFNKLHGRVGDTPIIGAGTWADDTVAVSGTGLGEAFIRTAATFDVSARVRYAGNSLDQATRGVLDEIARVGGEGGLIAVDRNGRISMPYNSQGMKRASVSHDSPPVVRVFEPEP